MIIGVLLAMVLSMCGMVIRADIIHVMRTPSFTVVFARCRRVAQIHTILVMRRTIASSWMPALGGIIKRTIIHVFQMVHWVVRVAAIILYV